MTRWTRAHAAAVLCFLAFGGATGRAREPWVILKECRLEENDSNDADSFHVKVGRKDYIFRLYFADAPETDASFPERVAEQAKYFGATVQQTVQLGSLAKKFTNEKLAQPFDARPLKSADDLRNVKGIGAKTSEKIRTFFL